MDIKFTSKWGFLIFIIIALTFIAIKLFADIEIKKLELLICIINIVFLFKEVKKSPFSTKNTSSKNSLYQMAAQLVHDINSPLAVIDMIRQSSAQYISHENNYIQSEAIKTIRNITNNLLAQYREDSIINNKPHKINYAILKSIINTIVIQKKIEWGNNPCEISYHIDQHIKNLIINIDLNKLKCILSNLLNNAYEALNYSRTIEITAQLTENKDQLQIKIKDTGDGISTENINKALSGISYKHPGKGMGLSSAKSYIESIGGSLNLFSKINCGSILTLTFPHKQHRLT